MKFAMDLAQTTEIRFDIKDALLWNVTRREGKNERSGLWTVDGSERTKAKIKANKLMFCLCKQRQTDRDRQKWIETVELQIAKENLKSEI